SGCSFYSFANVDLNTYVAGGTHPPNHVNTCGDLYLRNGLDGKIYNFGYLVAWDIKISRYNSDTNSHERVLGNMTQGFCPDNTPALFCPTRVTDYFITKEGKIFLID